MKDIESTVVDVLRNDAGAPVRADGLHEGALKRARSLRRRRRMLAAGAGALTVAAVAAGLTAVTGLMHGGAARPPASGSAVANGPDRVGSPPRDTGPTTLPPVAGVPGAADAPGTVGTNAGVLHFAVDLAAV